LATAPLHIAVATRIHADPVVSMFVTVSFVVLYFGLTQRSKWLLFVAGLAIGGIFWTKELAAVTWVAFVPLLWVFREQWRKVYFVVAGTILMLLLHGMLMYFIADDPLHLIKVVTGALKRNFIGASQGEDGVLYYLKYLFIDLRHTGPLGYLALISVTVWARVRHDTIQSLPIMYVIMWWLGLLVVLSALPVSLSPLRFPMKQSNYITLFLAPTALLAAITIAALPRISGRVLLVACMIIGVTFGLLQQADYRVFTANTKALAEFANEHPHSIIVGSVNNSRLGNLLASQMGHGVTDTKIISFENLSENKTLIQMHLLEADTIYVVLDRETMNWVSKAPTVNPLDCWVFEKKIEPTGFGFGNIFAKFLSETHSLPKPISAAFGYLAQPQEADIYRIKGHNVMCSK